MHVPLDKAKIIEFFLYTTMGKEKAVKLLASLYNSMFYNMWTFIFPKWIKRRKKKERFKLESYDSQNGLFGNKVGHSN